MIPNKSSTYEVVMKIILYLGIATWGTILKGCSISKVENHYSGWTRFSKEQIFIIYRKRWSQEQFSYWKTWFRIRCFKLLWNLVVCKTGGWNWADNYIILYLFKIIWRSQLSRLLTFYLISLKWSRAEIHLGTLGHFYLVSEPFNVSLLSALNGH